MNYNMQSFVDRYRREFPRLWIQVVDFNDEDPPNFDDTQDFSWWKFVDTIIETPFHEALPILDLEDVRSRIELAMNHNLLSMDIACILDESAAGQFTYSRKFIMHFRSALDRRNYNAARFNVLFS